MATVLVTGGAGYVGSHICLALKRAGHGVIAFDNLSNGHAKFVKWGDLEYGDICDRERLGLVFEAHRPDAVIHCAASIEIDESTAHPDRFYRNNVVGALTLLDAMVRHGVKLFVFSSSCAIYGEPELLPLTEAHRLAPISPYGWSKLMVEQISRDIAAAHGTMFAHLRYFNAAGAAPEEGIGERHQPESHALPLALFTLLGRQDEFCVFGRDYATRDGSCLRDYVHVLDLADAHVRAVERLLAGGDSLVANLGTGQGTTVLELLEAIERLTGKPVPTIVRDRRRGDAPALVADNALAKRELGWAPSRDLSMIIADAWKWHAQVEPMVFDK
jgi:UDP-glucose 4-epimerase